MNDKWTGRLLGRIFLLKHVIEKNIEWMERGRRRCKQLLVALRKREDTGR
jgi:hypothetical protein